MYFTLNFLARERAGVILLLNTFPPKWNCFLCQCVFSDRIPSWKILLCLCVNMLIDRSERHSYVVRRNNWNRLFRVLVNLQCTCLRKSSFEFTAFASRMGRYASVWRSEWYFWVRAVLRDWYLLLLLLLRCCLILPWGRNDFLEKCVWRWRTWGLVLCWWLLGVAI